MSAISREIHFFEATGLSEGWESLSGTEWMQVDKVTFSDWPGNSYRYYRWNTLTVPIMDINKPPRFNI